jgi:MFS superfamily sulfate permease-like transporter
MKRFMQVVLGINIAIAAAFDVIGIPFHVGPNARLAAAEPIATRWYAAVALGYVIVLLFLVWRRFEREPDWLLVPAIFLFALWLDAVYELTAGTGPVSENLPPTIVRLILVACYVAGYVTLRRRTPERLATTANATGHAGAAGSS